MHLQTEPSNIKTKFRFKQFEMFNSESAMKISTDSVILGSWADINNVSSAIDAGSGTGLLALMIAQKGVKSVICVESDDKAVDESIKNIGNSRWADNIIVLKGNICETNLPIVDMIISNPPYFDKNTNSIVSPKEAREKARHENDLSYSWLIYEGRKYIYPEGKIIFISPYEREDEIEFMIELSGMKIRRKCFVASSPKKNISRILWQISPVEGNIDISHLTIHNPDGSYNDDYIALTKDFYVKF